MKPTTEELREALDPFGKMLPDDSIMCIFTMDEISALRAMVERDAALAAYIKAVDGLVGRVQDAIYDPNCECAECGKTQDALAAVEAAMKERKERGR